MTCPPPEALFLTTHPEHLAGRMHLHSCARCRAWVEEDRDLERALLRVPCTMPDGDFLGEVMQRVEALPGQYLVRTFAWIWGGGFFLWCAVMGAPGVSRGLVRGVESMQQAAAQAILLTREASAHGWSLLSPWFISVTLILSATAWLFRQLAFSRFLR